MSITSISTQYKIDLKDALKLAEAIVMIELDREITKEQFQEVREAVARIQKIAGLEVIYKIEATVI